MQEAEAEVVQAERRVVEALPRLGWSEADLKARREGELRKVELAWELRSRSTMPSGVAAATQDQN